MFRGQSTPSVGKILKCDDFPEFLFFYISTWSFASNRDGIARKYFTDRVLGLDAPGLHLILKVFFFSFFRLFFLSLSFFVSFFLCFFFSLFFSLSLFVVSFFLSTFKKSVLQKTSLQRNNYLE